MSTVWTVTLLVLLFGIAWLLFGIAYRLDRIQDALRSIAASLTRDDQ